jgi:hypothetical protein
MCQKFVLLTENGIMSTHPKRISFLFIGSLIGGGLLGIGLFSLRKVSLFDFPPNISRIVLIIELKIISHFFSKFQWAAGTWNIHHPDLQRNIVLVTGGSSGIGLETAKELAFLNGQVVIG